MRHTALIVAVGGLLATHTALAQSTAPSATTSSRATSAGGLATPSTGATTSAEMAKMNAHAFAKNMAMSDMFEIESSNLALQRAKSTDVKNFARMMVTDHTKSTEKLKAAASKDNLASDLPKSLDQEHNTMLEKLRNASGSAFDRAYLTDQVQGHEQAVSMLRNYSQNGDNADLKQLASDVLPVVEHHLSEAQKLEAPASAAR